MTVFVLETQISAIELPTFDRGLPTDNLNNTLGSYRSNVAWSNGNEYVSGDDFIIGEIGEKWVVTGIRTWSVGNVNYLGDLFSKISLYTGTGGVSLLTSGDIAISTNMDSNPNITHSIVNYPGTDITYQTTVNRTIWQHDFTNLDWKIDGGVKYYFAVDGTLREQVTYYWFNHASNADLSVSTQDGANDRWLVWNKNDLTINPFECDSAGGGGICDGGWDKSSDINIQIFAHQIPNKSERVDICHKEGKKGTHHLISVDLASVPAHLAHGDAYPGGYVNNTGGDIFNDDCTILNYIDTVVVPSDQSNETISGLDPQITYQLNARGTYTYASWEGEPLADAKCSYGGPNDPLHRLIWTSGDDLPPAYLHYLEVRINGEAVDWGIPSGKCNEEHTYTMTITGEDQLAFSIFDGGSIGDNNRNIFVDIYAQP